MFVPGGLWAQGGSTGAITGTVKDATGAVIQNAHVVVISQETGTRVREMATTQAGTFSATFLPPGTYKLEVTAPGFRKFEARDVPVRVSETADVVAQMEIGEATQSVTIEAAATPLQLSTPTMGETIMAHTVENLPLSKLRAHAPRNPGVDAVRLG